MPGEETSQEGAVDLLLQNRAKMNVGYKRNFSLRNSARLFFT